MMDYISTNLIPVALTVVVCYGSKPAEDQRAL